jgi:hypothetical protein
MLKNETIEMAIELLEGGANESTVAEATGISKEEAKAVADALCRGSGRRSKGAMKKPVENSPNISSELPSPQTMEHLKKLGMKNGEVNLLARQRCQILGCPEKATKYLEKPNGDRLYLCDKDYAHETSL